MDLVKIGKYIAGKRKDSGLTQRELAEKLGMSDKSVSKWERGVCLPDVSVYSDLCSILGITLNEFLAGEDIAREDIMQKSEENIISVSVDSKRRQKRLRIMIYALSVIIIAALIAGGIMLYRACRPQNYIAPVEKDSIEMETARLLSGPDGAFLYKFTTTDEYKSLSIYVSEYHKGELVDKGKTWIGFEGIGSPERGEILIVPDFSVFSVKLIAAVAGSKMSTDIPILEDVPDREYYGRAAGEIREKTDIRYNEEQPLLALIYGKDGIRTVALEDLAGGQSDALAYNDYVYLFTFEFGK